MVAGGAGSSCFLARHGYAALERLVERRRALDEHQLGVGAGDGGLSRYFVTDLPPRSVRHRHLEKVARAANDAFGDVKESAGAFRVKLKE